MTQQRRGGIAGGSMKVIAPIMAVEAELGSAAVAVQLMRLDVAGPDQELLLPVLDRLVWLPPYHRQKRRELGQRHRTG